MTQRLRYAFQIAAVAVAYYAAARVGLLAAVAPSVVSSAWPPSGVALAALLLLGLRLWPGIALGAFLLNWTAGVSAAGAAGIALGNTRPSRAPGCWGGWWTSDPRSSGRAT